MLTTAMLAKYRQECDTIIKTIEDMCDNSKNGKPVSKTTFEIPHIKIFIEQAEKSKDAEYIKQIFPRLEEKIKKGEDSTRITVRAPS